MDTRTLPAPGPNRTEQLTANPPDEIKPAEAVAAIADVATDIATDAQTLIEEHGNLLKAEMKELGGQAVVAAVTAAAAAVGMAIGLLFVFVGLVRLTAWAFPSLPEWAAWLIWGGGLAVGCAVLTAVAGRSLSKLNLYPRRTLRSLLESWSWLVNRKK